MALFLLLSASIQLIRTLMVALRHRLCAGCRFGGVALAWLFASTVVYGGESCGAWLMTSSDPAGGKYLMTLQLRSCDLTGGVSAFLQFQNSGTERLKLSYRVQGEEKIIKEGSLVVEPGETKRDATCQQCAKRKGGIKSWEIVSIEVLPQDESSVSAPAPLAVETEKKQEEQKLENPVESTQPVQAQPQGMVTEDGKIIPWDKLPPEFRPKNN